MFIDVQNLSFPVSARSTVFVLFFLEHLSDPVYVYILHAARHGPGDPSSTTEQLVRHGSETLFDFRNLAKAMNAPETRDGALRVVSEATTVNFLEHGF